MTDLPLWLTIPGVLLAVVLGAAIRHWAYRGHWRK